MKRIAELVLASLVVGACANDPYPLDVKRVEVSAVNEQWCQWIFAGKYGSHCLMHDKRVMRRFAVSRDGRYCPLADAEQPRVGRNHFCAWVEREDINWWNQ